MGGRRGLQLFEATDRLGGRILTVDATGAPSDDGFALGPSWIWPRMQPALAALAHELGLPTFGQTSAGDVVFERMSREPAQRYAGPAHEPQSMRLAGRTAALVSAMAPTIHAACAKVCPRSESPGTYVRASTGELVLGGVS